MKDKMLDNRILVLPILNSSWGLFISIVYLFLIDFTGLFDLDILRNCEALGSISNTKSSLPIYF